MAKKIIVREQSKRFSLNSFDWHRLGKGALIAIGAGILTFLEQNFSNFDFGKYQILASIGNAILIQLIRLWITGPTQ